MKWKFKPQHPWGGEGEKYVPSWIITKSIGLDMIHHSQTWIHVKICLREPRLLGLCIQTHQKSFSNRNSSKKMGEKNPWLENSLGILVMWYLKIYVLVTSIWVKKKTRRFPGGSPGVSHRACGAAAPGGSKTWGLKSGGFFTNLS